MDEWKPLDFIFSLRVDSLILYVPVPSDSHILDDDDDVAADIDSTDTESDTIKEL